MKHIEKHTYVIEYGKVAIDLYKLDEEVKLFKQAYPNADVNLDIFGQVSISYVGSASRLLAQGAAYAFKEAVVRHSWWVEVI